MQLPIDFAAQRQRLAAHLATCSRKYPQAWRQIDVFRAARGKPPMEDWPPWCFCPLSGAHAIVCEQHRMQNLNRFSRFSSYSGDADADEALPIHDVGRIGGLSAWRTTQGIYAIDPTVLDAVWDTPASGQVPVDILLNLPEWCVYVPLPPGFEYVVGPGAPSEIIGFFAYLERDVGRGHIELRILVDIARLPPNTSLASEIIHLHRGMSIAECYDEMLDESARQAEKAGRSAELHAITGILRSNAVERLSPLLSVLLYLCSRTAEFQAAAESEFSRPANPTARKTKDGWRLFPPPSPKIWRVGERLGQAIRDAYDRERTESGERSGPRPHVRRAHWHHFWVGPRDSPSRRLDLKWLPPIPVAMVDDSPEARMRLDKPKRIKNLDAAIEAAKSILETNTDGNPGDD